MSPRPNPSVGSGRIWSDLVGFGRIWTDLDGFGRIWTDLDGFGRIRTDLVGFLNNKKESFKWVNFEIRKPIMNLTHPNSSLKYPDRVVGVCLMLLVFTQCVLSVFVEILSK